MAGRTGRFLGNAAGVAVGKVTYLLTGLLVVPIVIERSDLVFYGVWAVVLQLLTWFQAVDLGIGFGLQNEVSRCASDGDADRSARVSGATGVLLWLIASLIFLLGFGVYFLCPEMLTVMFADSAGEHESSARILVVTAVVAIGLQLGGQSLTRVLAGLERQGLIWLAQGCGAVLGLGWIYFGGNLLAGCIVFALLPSIFPIALAAMLLRRKSLLPYMPQWHWSWQRCQPILSVGLGLFVSQVAAVAVFQSDIFIVSIFLGSFEAGRYELVARLMAVPLFALGMILAAWWPAVSRSWQSGDKQWVVGSYRYLLYLWLASMPAVGLLVWFSGDMIVLWSGTEDARPDPLVVVYYAVFVVGAIWCNIHAQALNAIGSVAATAKWAVLHAGVNAPLSVIAIHVWGAQGVALASAVSVLLVPAFPLAKRWREKL